MPGSWPKSKTNKESKKLGAELPSKEKKLLALVNSIYQKLVLVEEKDIVFSLKADIIKFHYSMEKMQKEAEEILFLNSFKDELEFDPNNLVLVAEKYLLANQKIKFLEEEIKKLRQSNSLLAEKNEF
jgi:hypothetical protein